MKSKNKNAAFSADEEGGIEPVKSAEQLVYYYGEEVKTETMNRFAASPHQLAGQDDFAARTAHELGLAEQFFDDEEYRRTYCERVIVRSDLSPEAKEPGIYLVSPGRRRKDVLLDFIRQQKNNNDCKVKEEFDSVTSEIVLFVTPLVKRLLIHKGFKVKRYDPEKRDRRG